MKSVGTGRNAAALLRDRRGYPQERRIDALRSMDVHAAATGSAGTAPTRTRLRRGLGIRAGHALGGGLNAITGAQLTTRVAPLEDLRTASARSTANIESSAILTNAAPTFSRGTVCALSTTTCDSRRGPFLSVALDPMLAKQPHFAGLRETEVAEQRQHENWPVHPRQVRETQSRGH